MTDISKRSIVKMVALTAVAAAALVGCGKKEEAPKAEAPAAAKPEPLKIAFAYVGPVGDGGWTFAHDNARKALEAEFGDKIKTSFTENVSESADAERNFRDMVSQGNKLIFGTTFGYMEPMLKVATDHKDVKFEHATGYKQAENMRTYDSRTYEGAYMAGIIAGKMTKTNTETKMKNKVTVSGVVESEGKLTVIGVCDDIPFESSPTRWGSKMLMKVTTPGEFTQGQKVAIGGACKKALAKAEVALPKAELVRPRKPKTEAPSEAAQEESGA